MAFDASHEAENTFAPASYEGMVIPGIYQLCNPIGVGWPPFTCFDHGHVR